MNTTIEEGKSIAITSYILIVGVLIAMSMNSENKNSFASFHIRQALGLSITFISLALIISPFLSLSQCGFVFLFYGLTEFLALFKDIRNLCRWLVNGTKNGLKP